MIVEIKGIGTPNKGSHLMLVAITQHFEAYDNEIDLAIEHGAGSYMERATLGLYQKVWFWHLGMYGGIVGHLIPQRIRKIYGLVNDREVDAILDASGFAYTDQFGPRKTEIMAQLCRKWKRDGKRIILLPQAFGPFSTKSIRSAFLEILNCADLIFVRDNVSYNHILDVRDQVPNVKIAPDFTNLVEGRIPAYFSPSSSRLVGIIPNFRMLDRTSKSMRDKYLPFLVMSIRGFVENSLTPFLLVHERDDYDFAIEINNSLDHPIDIVCEEDPCYVKGIIGSCYGVLSSRYHGLVSALSQGIPSLATGWSHKYLALLQDYGCPENLISLLDPQEEIEKKLAVFSNEAYRDTMIEKLNTANGEQRSKAIEMWNDVHRVLNLE